MVTVVPASDADEMVAVLPVIGAVRCKVSAAPSTPMVALLPRTMGDADQVLEEPAALRSAPLPPATTTAGLLTVTAPVTVVAVICGTLTWPREPPKMIE